MESVKLLRVPCADCGIMIELPAHLAGMSNWNVCEFCGRAIDDEMAEILASRGIDVGRGKVAAQ